MSKFLHDTGRQRHRRRHQGYHNISTFSSKTVELKIIIKYSLLSRALQTKIKRNLMAGFASLLRQFCSQYMYCAKSIENDHKTVNVSLSFL